jgi:hypothetical protein
MTKLLVNPTFAAFSAQFGANALSTELDGGAGRYRLDKIGSAHKAQVQWMLTAKAYNYLMAFYRTEIDYGSLPFTIDISGVDAAALTTYTAHIVPGTLSLTACLGDMYQMSATLEITPLAENSGADATLVSGGPV